MGLEGSINGVGLPVIWVAVSDFDVINGVINI